MDLLGGTGQPAQMNCAFGGGTGGEKPGTADAAMSRPSLISSLWSIQVQNEGSASDFPMAGCGSQQSLPEMLNQVGAAPYLHCNGFSGPAGLLSSSGGAPGQIQSDLAGAPMDLHQPAVASQSPGTSLRPVKSLSDLHTLTAGQIAQTASVMPCPQHQNVPTGATDQSYLGFRRQTETGAFYNALSRQQRDSQICEWLQKLNVGGGATEPGGGGESPSQEYYQQQQQRPPPFQRADTTEQ